MVLRGSSLCDSATAEDDIRGKDIKLVYSDIVAYTNNVLKDGRIFAFNPNGGSCPGASGDEANLSRAHSYVIRCKSGHTNRARSPASYAGGMLRLIFDIRFGGNTGFNYDWTINIRGSCNCVKMDQLEQ
jgi:hypothetical protein